MKLKYFFKVISLNLLVFLLCLSLGTLTLRSIKSFQQQKEAKKENKTSFNLNTIRATYPPYAHMSKKDALAIFSGYAGPSTNYAPFTGWRRLAYKSKAVNIESEYRTRLSINHQIDGSVWFFGGSTMWGTGSDDANTIPSLYSRLTSETVWNLGESSYNSFQEFTQLSVLLAKGLKPKRVIFYDGVNDSFYCYTNNQTFPNHSRAQIWEQYIRDYGSLERKNKELKTKLEAFEKGSPINGSGEIVWLMKSIYNYFIEPYQSLYHRITDKRILGKKVNTDLKFNTPISKFKITDKYKNCHKDADKLKKSSSTTINTWLLTHDLLKARGIEFKVFLQPTAQIAPNRLKLDYLVDSQKQRIVNESASYQAQYEAIRNEWVAQCGAHKACDSFHDISDILNNLDQEFYIDAIHISPQGNQIVAQKMASLILSK